MFGRGIGGGCCNGKKVVALVVYGSNDGGIGGMMVVHWVSQSYLWSVLKWSQVVVKSSLGCLKVVSGCRKVMSGVP